MKNVIHCIIKQRFSVYSLSVHTSVARESTSFFFFFSELYSVFLCCLKHKSNLSPVPAELGRTRLGPAFQMEPFSPYVRKSTQEGQTRCPHKLWVSTDGHSLSHCFFVSPAPINSRRVSRMNAQGGGGFAFVFSSGRRIKSLLVKGRRQQTDICWRRSSPLILFLL